MRIGLDTGSPVFGFTGTIQGTSVCRGIKSRIAQDKEMKASRARINRTKARFLSTAGLVYISNHACLAGAMSWVAGFSLDLRKVLTE